MVQPGGGVCVWLSTTPPPHSYAGLRPGLPDRCRTGGSAHVGTEETVADQLEGHSTYIIIVHITIWLCILYTCFVQVSNLVTIILLWDTDFTYNNYNTLLFNILYTQLDQEMGVYWHWSYRSVYMDPLHLIYMTTTPARLLTLVMGTCSIGMARGQLLWENRSSKWKHVLTAMAISIDWVNVVASFHSRITNINKRKMESVNLDSYRNYKINALQSHFTSNKKICNHN